MYEKFAALAFALIVTVKAQDDYYPDDTTAFAQTPEPEFPEDWAEYLTIPDDFGDFENNVESVGLALWFDGDDSDIFAWADDNYVDGVDTSFGFPTGDVFMAEVTFIEDITSDEAQYLCFDFFVITWCAATTQGQFISFSIEFGALEQEDGEFDIDTIEYDIEENDEEFDGEGAGIGVEFGHSYDDIEYIWSVWNYGDDGYINFEEASYDVYVIQQNAEGTEYLFSDTLDLVYNGASEIASVAIASATVLYALI